MISMDLLWRRKDEQKWNSLTLLVHQTTDESLESCPCFGAKEGERYCQHPLNHLKRTWTNQWKGRKLSYFPTRRLFLQFSTTFLLLDNLLGEAELPCAFPDQGAVEEVLLVTGAGGQLCRGLLPGQNPSRVLASVWTVTPVEKLFAVGVEVDQGDFALWVGAADHGRRGAGHHCAWCCVPGYLQPQKIANATSSILISSLLWSKVKIPRCDQFLLRQHLCSSSLPSMEVDERYQ